MAEFAACLKSIEAHFKAILSHEQILDEYKIFDQYQMKALEFMK